MALLEFILNSLPSQVLDTDIVMVVHGAGRPSLPFGRTLLISNKTAHFLQEAFTLQRTQNYYYEPWSLDHVFMWGGTWNSLYNGLYIFLYPEADQTLPLESWVLLVSPVTPLLCSMTWIVSSA